MLMIRMQRIGRINSPSFRIVVVEHARSTKSGNIVEQVGTYNPRSKIRTLNVERIKYWLSVGAKASDTVHNALITMGVVSGKKINVLPKKSPPKVEGEEKAAEAPAPAETPAKEEDAPAGEVVAA